MSNPSPIQHVADASAGALILGSLLNWLPAAAAILGIFWYAIQIYESKTVQGWLANRQVRSKARKLASLEAQRKLVEAELLALQTVQAASNRAEAVIQEARTEATVAAVVGGAAPGK